MRRYLAYDFDGNASNHTQVFDDPERGTENRMNDPVWRPLTPTRSELENEAIDESGDTTDEEDRWPDGGNASGTDDDEGEDGDDFDDRGLLSGEDDDDNHPETQHNIVNHAGMTEPSAGPDGPGGPSAGAITRPPSSQNGISAGLSLPVHQAPPRDGE